jgi:hypothetical protein
MTGDGRRDGIISMIDELLRERFKAPVDNAGIWLARLGVTVRSRVDRPGCWTACQA